MQTCTEKKELQSICLSDDISMTWFILTLENLKPCFKIIKYYVQQAGTVLNIDQYSNSFQRNTRFCFNTTLIKYEVLTWQRYWFKVS